MDVTLLRRGHVDPYASGTLVAWRLEGGGVASELDPKLPYHDEKSGCHYLRMKQGTTGIVMDRAWNVPHLELMRAELDPIFDCRRTKPRLRNVFMELHYQVLFAQGLYWARFDWLDEVTPV